MLLLSDVFYANASVSVAGIHIIVHTVNARLIHMEEFVFMHRLPKNCMVHNSYEAILAIPIF